jgi:toxin ParE1/3/4
VSGYRLSFRAETDLIDIWDYTQAKWSSAQADVYIRLLHGGMATVASDPRLGRNCDQVRRGYRRYAIGSHAIFFRVAKDHIEIMRVLHQRMDARRHL